MMDHGPLAWLAAVALAIAVAGCASSRPAPVIDRASPTGRPSTAPVKASPAAPAPSIARGTGAETHVVKRGDTLYSIALDNGYDYRELAELNGITNPNQIGEGQVLRLKRPPASPAVQTRPVTGQGVVESRTLDAPKQVVAPKTESAVTSELPSTAAPKVEAAGAAIDIKTEPAAVKLPYTPENLAMLSRERTPTQIGPGTAVKLGAAAKQPAAEAAPAPSQPASGDQGDEAVDWGWPTTGRIIAGFSESSNKGLDIGGTAGQAVLASASGTVLYVGSGIRGYGKLIVLRHSRTYSTVYAHNSEILVKEGQRVVKGQKIAEMGKTDTDQVKLHFEIRRLGKPTDPAKYLPEKSS